ncbi:MAG: pyridoxal phosphate-dependent aminotransferase [Clostridia bacterium]|nr:pyridoxal phosphate-dependent aminotransferase [Clostridia bacterium]
MPNEKMYAFGAAPSAIREIFEYGNRRRAEIGAENVFDLSLGNPSIEPPESFMRSLKKHLESDNALSLFGYTSGPGAAPTRKAIADSIKRRFSFEAEPSDIYMTCGAAASLTITLNALCDEGDGVVLLAPFFPEYRVFAEKAGARVSVVKCKAPDFQPDIEALSAAIDKNTRAVIINSPNNPTGAVYGEEVMRALASMLESKQKEFGRDIFIIADEPYRELCYTAAPPYIPALYANTVVCYSYSKSLSVPGERIGYIFVSPRAHDAKRIFAAVCGAGRALGFVCAPSLMQKVIADCVYDTSDISKYKENRDLLLKGLTDTGYEVSPPDGAFYVFMKCLEPAATAFCERAKKYEVLIVPGDSFGGEGYARLAYCVDKKTIEGAIAGLSRLYKEYEQEK